MYQKFYAAADLITKIRENNNKLEINLTDIRESSFSFILEELQKNDKLEKVILQNWRFQEASRPILQHLMNLKIEIYCICSQVLSDALFKDVLGYENLKGFEITQKRLSSNKLLQIENWLNESKPTDFRISTSDVIDQDSLHKLLSCSGIKHLKRLSLDKTKVDSECSKAVLSLITSLDASIETVSLEKCKIAKKDIHTILGNLSKCVKAPDLQSLFLNGFQDLRSAPFSK